MDEWMKDRRRERRRRERKKKRKKEEEREICDHVNCAKRRKEGKKEGKEKKKKGTLELATVSGGMSTLPRKWKRDAILRRSGDGPINREKRGSWGFRRTAKKEWARTVKEL